MQLARGVTSQRRQRGMRASQLEVLAAELALSGRPAGSAAGMAVELHAVLLLALLTAPILPGWLQVPNTSSQDMTRS